MKENKTGLIILISVLTAVIVILMGTLVFLLAENRNKENRTGKKVREETQKTKQGTDAPITTGVQQEVSGGPARPVVFKGYEFQVPVDYGCIIAEGMGPVVYMSDIFQLRLRVEDKNYETYTKDPEHAMQNAKDAGGEITKEVTESEIKGHKIAWYRTSLQDDDMVVMWSAADENRMFGGQMVILSQDMKEEDFLNVFAQVIESAEETDKPDSTTDDFTITFPVPEGFYAQDDEVYVTDEKDYYSDDYMTNDFVSVSCRVTKDFFENARAEIQSDWNYENAEIKTLDAGGRTFYYATAEKNSDGKRTQYVIAVCELPECGWIYSVEADATDCEREITIDDMKGFLSFTCNLSVKK